MYGYRVKGLLECAQISSVIKVIPFVGILQGGSSFAKCRLEEEGRSDVKSRLREFIEPDDGCNPADCLQKGRTPKGSLALRLIFVRIRDCS